MQPMSYDRQLAEVAPDGELIQPHLVLNIVSQNWVAEPRMMMGFAAAQADILFRPSASSIKMLHYRVA